MTSLDLEPSFWKFPPRLTDLWRPKEVHASARMRRRSVTDFASMVEKSAASKAGGKKTRALASVFFGCEMKKP